MHIHHKIWLEKAGAGIAKINRYIYRTDEEIQVFIIRDTQEKAKIQQGGERNGFETLKRNVKVG